jgi:cellulose biosynthesis protein BcsQ
MLSNGKIITFYSYKGGTGRTMAAANMAWILASNRRKVLLIDWDLESPGLHRYLRPFLADPDLTHTAGLIDFMRDAAETGHTASLLNYVVPVDWKFPAGGSIEFVAAGRQDANYRRRANSFNWSDFYERRGGSRLVATERERLKASYDYVLIDSRTGVSDTSSICTVQMPDLLVVLFTLNHQSIEGAAAMAASIQAQRAGLPIFPVPTRIEYGEQDKLSAALAFARRMFTPFLLHVQSDRREIDLEQQASYWRDVETPYVAYYAFEEVLAAFKDELGSRRGLLAASERLSSWITDRVVSSLKFDGNENRRSLLDAFAFDQNRAVKFDRTTPVRKSRPFARLEAIAYRLVRYRWQAATLALAVAVAVMLAQDYIKTRPVKHIIPPVPAEQSDVIDPSSPANRNNVTNPMPAPRQSGEPLLRQRQ